MKPLVLIDFDGVIADSFEFCYSKIRIDRSLDRDGYRRFFEGNVIVNTRSNLSKDEQTALLKKIYDGYNAGIMNVLLFEGIREELAALSKNHSLAIMSSADNGPIEQFLRQHTLFHHFETIRGRDNGESKTQKIHDILAEYGKEKHRCVMVTDTLGDVLEANHAGIHSLAVLWGFHQQETLDRGRPFGLIDHPSKLSACVENYFKTSLLLNTKKSRLNSATFFLLFRLFVE